MFPLPIAPEMQSFSNQVAFLGLFVSLALSLFLFMVWLIVKEVSPSESGCVLNLGLFCIVCGIMFLVLGAYLLIALLVFAGLVLLLTLFSIIKPSE